MVIILGKTCSGKDIIVNKLINQYDFKKVITSTTRPMRKGEKQDITYHFISKINLCEWGHVFGERNENGGANPEVKEWAERGMKQITDMHHQITRDYVLSIKN